MGWSESTSSSTVKTGELSERGKQYDQLFNTIMGEQFDNYGYDLNFQEKTVYKDAGKANELTSKINDLESKIAAIKGNDAQAQAQKSALQNQKANIQSQLDGMEKSIVKDFDLKEKVDPRVQAAIDKYGEGSPQAMQIQEQLKSDELAKLDALGSIDKTWVKNLNKFSSGDMSYTPEQEQQIDAFIGPIKNVINQTTNDLLAQYKDSDKMLRDALGDLSAEINKTGYDVSSALEAASVQYEQSGKTLFGVLKEVNSSNYAKAKFEFDLLSQKADTQAAQQGALLGLPPGSQSEKVAAMKMKTDALKSIELDLAAKEAAGALAIQQGVEQGKQSISLAKVNLAESQGGKKEKVAENAFGLTELLTNKIEGVMGNKANAEIGLAQKKSDMLFGAAYGNLPGQIQAGQQGLAFAQQQKDAKNANLQQLLNSAGGQLGVEQQRQLAETTTTQKKTPSFLDSFTDILGAATSVAGTVMGFPGLGGGGSGGGGGGGAPQTYSPNPAQQDFSIYKNSNPGNFTLDY